MEDDDQSLLALVNTPEATGHTKHVNMAFHMARDYQVRWEVALYFLPSAEVPAYGLTNSLLSPSFTALQAVVRIGKDLSAAARGVGHADPLLWEC